MTEADKVKVLLSIGKVSRKFFERITMETCELKLNDRDLFAYMMSLSSSITLGTIKRMSNLFIIDEIELLNEHIIIIKNEIEIMKEGKIVQ